MLQLSRKLHCALAGLQVEGFKTLQEYRRLPRVPNELKADKPFGPFETFMLATYNALVEYNRVPRERAADICSAGAALFAARWADLRETAEERRLAKKSELLFGRVDLAGTPKQDGGTEPVLGTLQEIAKQISAIEKIAPERKAFAITAVSVTRVASQIHNRAAEHGIDIEQFWAAPFPTPASKARPAKKGAAR
jgi:hypothetical protein